MIQKNTLGKQWWKDGVDDTDECISKLFFTFFHLYVALFPLWYFYPMWQIILRLYFEVVLFINFYLQIQIYKLKILLLRLPAQTQHSSLLYIQLSVICGKFFFPCRILLYTFHRKLKLEESWRVKQDNFYLKTEKKVSICVISFIHITS